MISHLHFRWVYLFIVGNPIEKFTAEVADLCQLGRLKTIITQGHLCSGRSNAVQEGNLRTQRHRKKLKQRIYEGNIPDVWPNNVDKKHAKKLRSILRSGEVKTIKLKDTKFENLEQITTPDFKNKIIFIGCHVGQISTSCRSRHAEELFVDLLEQLDPDPNIHSIVGGKKRPCAGCFGRMLQARVDEHGKNPGHFWEHSIKFQSSSAAKTTARALIDRPAYESYNKNKTTTLNDFDSGSNSD